VFKWPWVVLWLISKINYKLSYLKNQYSYYDHSSTALQMDKYYISTVSCPQWGMVMIMLQFLNLKTHWPSLHPLQLHTFIWYFILECSNFTPRLWPTSSAKFIQFPLLGVIKIQDYSFVCTLYFVFPGSLFWTKIKSNKFYWMTKMLRMIEEQQM